MPGHKLAHFLEEGELLRGTDKPPFAEAWALADAETFAPRHIAHDRLPQEETETQS